MLQFEAGTAMAKICNPVQGSAVHQEGWMVRRERVILAGLYFH